MGIFVGKKNGSSILHLTTEQRDASDQDPRLDSIFHSDLPYISVKKFTSTNSTQGKFGSKDFDVPIDQLNQINLGKVVLFFFVDQQDNRYAQYSNITYSFMHGISFYEPSRCFFDINVFNPVCSEKSLFIRGEGTTARVTNIEQEVLYTNQTKIGTTLPNITKLEQVVLENISWGADGSLFYSTVQKPSNEILVNNTQLVVGGVDVLRMPILARYTQAIPSTPNTISVPAYCSTPLAGQPGFINFQVSDYPTSILLPGDDFIAGPRWISVVQAQSQFSQGISRTTTKQVNSRVGVGETQIQVKVPIFGVHGGQQGKGVELISSVPKIVLNGQPVYQPGIDQLYTVSTGITVIVPQYYETLYQNISTQQSIDRDVLLRYIDLGLSGHQSGLYQISQIDPVTIPQYRNGISDSIKKFLAIPQQSGRLQQLQQFEEGLYIPLITITQVGGANQKSYEVFGYKYQVYMVRVGSGLEIRAKVSRVGQATGPGDLQLTQTLQLPKFTLSILPFMG